MVITRIFFEELVKLFAFTTKISVDFRWDFVNILKS